MFGLGMLEVALIAVVVVMLFPPSELPKLARGAARLYGMVRRTADDFRNAILHDDDLREPFEDIKGAYDGARWEIQKAREEARREIAKTRMQARIAAKKKGPRRQDTKDPRLEAANADAHGDSDAPATPLGPVSVAREDPLEADASPPSKPLFAPPPPTGASSDEEGAA